jgi:hypothetical protein
MGALWDTYRTACERVHATFPGQYLGFLEGGTTHISPRLEVVCAALNIGTQEVGEALERTGVYVSSASPKMIIGTIPTEREWAWSH